MFCANCGTQIKDEVLFCPNCGAKQEIKEEKAAPIVYQQNAQNSAAKTKFIIPVVIVLVLSLVFGGILLSRSGDVTGHWVVSEKSINENLRDYPEENFIIYDNGSFTFDGISGTYLMDDDTITFSHVLFGSETYEYTVSRNTLTLKTIDDEDDPKIYYDRVS